MAADDVLHRPAVLVIDDDIRRGELRHGLQQPELQLLAAEATGDGDPSALPVMPPPRTVCIGAEHLRHDRLELLVMLWVIALGRQLSESQDAPAGLKERLQEPCSGDASPDSPAARCTDTSPVVGELDLRPPLGRGQMAVIDIVIVVVQTQQQIGDLVNTCWPGSRTHLLSGEHVGLHGEDRLKHAGVGHVVPAEPNTESRAR